MHSLLPSSTVAQAQVTSPLKCILPISSRRLYLLFWIEAIHAFPFYVSIFQPFQVTISCQIKELDYTSYNQAFPIRIGQTEIQSRKDGYHHLRNRAGKCQQAERSDQEFILIPEKTPLHSCYACVCRQRNDQGDKCDGKHLLLRKKTLTKQFPKIFNDDVSWKKI